MKPFAILLFLLSSLCLSAQDIEVKKFEPNEKDQTAALSPRKDINGVTCGLVKVLLKEPGAEFEGSVMGDVQFTGFEYLVFLPNGTKRLGIKHPDYLPTTIVFADYGTKKIESGVTYQLKLKANKKPVKVDKSKKGIAVFNIKPSNAMLLIDGQIADGSGGAYTLSLPFGTHYYTVKIKDFSLNNQIVHIDKEAKTINVDLTEFFAKVDVSCKTTDAEITVNGEQKGIGKWSSMVAPGKYTIEASKDGCHSQMRQIELRDNETMTIDFTALKTITGSLRVDYEPAGADVLLNGKKVGVTPLVSKELPVGTYQMEIWKEYYVKEFATVMIREDQEWHEEGKLELTHFGRMIVNAEKEHSPWDCIVSYYRYGNGINESGFPDDICGLDSVFVPYNPVKAIFWCKKMMNEGYEGYKDVYKEWLGPCYSLTNDDAELSFCWAKKAVEEYDDVFGWDGNNPNVTLAWHYFYGIGCEKDIEKAKQLIRTACTENGEYAFPAFMQIIKDMGLDNELKYNPHLDYLHLDDYE